MEASTPTLGSIGFQGLDVRAIWIKDPTLQVQVAVAEVQVVITAGGDQELLKSTTLQTWLWASVHQVVIDDVDLQG